MIIHRTQHDNEDNDHRSQDDNEDSDHGSQDANEDCNESCPFISMRTLLKTPKVKEDSNDHGLEEINTQMMMQCKLLEAASE